MRWPSPPAWARTFDPFASETNFLLGAFIFEDVGVTAYQGAAGLIQDKTYLDKAAGIHQRRGLSRRPHPHPDLPGRSRRSGRLPRPSPPPAPSSTAPGTTTSALASTSGAATIVDADANAMTFARTTAQVLKIVYGGGSASGAFFPNGLNGTIK